MGRRESARGAVVLRAALLSISGQAFVPNLRFQLKWWKKRKYKKTKGKKNGKKR